LPQTGGLVAGLLWAAISLSGGFGALCAWRGSWGLGMLATAFALWPVAAELGRGGLVVGLFAAPALAARWPPRVA
jgi:hypothetical protein